MSLSSSSIFQQHATAATAGVATGVYIPGAAQEPQLLDQFETQVGQPTGIVHWYQPWGADYSNESWYQPMLDTTALRTISDRGAMPLITWEAWGTVNGSDPSRVRTIPTGVYDTYIDTWATGLANFGRPVYLRLFHELNNPSYPWAYGNNGNSAEDLIAAWRYVHDRFEAKGATNVQWVWAPNTESQLVSFRTLYPGDAYVDWLGVDGYNGGDVYPEWWGGWVSPTAVFENSLNKLAAINATKPIMIVETATVEQGGNKAAWINELYSQLPEQFPQIRAILWFNADWGDSRANWLVDSSSSSLDAYRSALQSPTGSPSPEQTTDGSYALSQVFSPFWNANGGLPIFGQAVTKELVANGYTAQYVERQRFEYHPENAGTRYEVLLGNVGVEDATYRGLLRSRYFKAASAKRSPTANCSYFRETSQWLCGGFQTYWKQNGLEFGDLNVSFREALALFGYPISEEFRLDGVTVQYFERARFEWHPENPTEYRVLLGRLGTDIATRAGLTQ